MTILKKALETALDLSKQNKRTQADALLRKIFEITQSEKTLELEITDVWKLAKALLAWYQIDNFESEQERLLVLKKSYLIAQQSIDNYEREQCAELLEVFYEALLVQIIILNNCTEDFEMIVADVYTRCTSETNSTIASRLAQKVVLHILYNTIVKIDDAFENFHNNEWIEKLCNDIEIGNPDLTPQQLINAEKIQKTIVAVLQNDTL